MSRHALLWGHGPINKMTMQLSSRLLLLTVALMIQISDVKANPLVSVTENAHCPSKQRTIVLTGQQAPTLLGLPIQSIALYQWKGDRLQPIVFQIDRRDKDNRYIFTSATISATDTKQAIFDENDELAFVQSDTSLRMPSQGDEAVNEGRLIEIQINNDRQQLQNWVYVKLLNATVKSSALRYINYNPETDSVFSNLYQLGFSRQAPFLVDRFSWWNKSSKQWSPDLLDTMKIHHSGKLFGLLGFSRTHKDYSSKLVAIKVGPVRVIRRTKNRVRVFLGLKSPTLYIDYVLAPDGFVMDTLIDIPFSMGLVFSQLETLTTVDWDSAEGFPRLFVSNEQLPGNLQIDGTMSEKKEAFNKISATNFGIENSLGTMQVRLDIPEDFPIDAYLYLRDVVREPDPPENITGQFGNVGFKTTGWENIDTEVKHLLFTVCLFRAH